MKSSGPGMAEWGLNRLTTLQITTVNSEQNTNNNHHHLKVLQSEHKLADFGEELKLGRRHQHGVSFLCLRHWPEGRLQSYYGAGQLNQQKPPVFLAKQPENRIWVSHSYKKVREEISKRRVSKEGNPRFGIQILPECLTDCWHAWSRLKATWLRLKELYQGAVESNQGSSVDDKNINTANITALSL